MQPNNLPYEVSAWVLTRERIGQSLRERYHVTTELPPALLTLVGKLDVLEGNLQVAEELPLSLPTLVGKLDALEGNLQVAEELPLSLPTLVRKLDSLEGNLLLRRMKDARAGPRKKPPAN